MKLLALIALLAAPAFGSRTAIFRVGAQVVRSSSVSAHLVDGRVEIEHRGPEPAARTERLPDGTFRVTLLY